MRTLLLSLGLIPTILLGETIPVENRGWVSSLREQVLAQPEEVDLVIRNQPLDQVVALTTSALKNVSILLPSQEPLPQITGKFSGHPLTTVEQLLSLYGYTIAERHGLFVIEKDPTDGKPFTETYYAQGLRFESGDQTRTSLEAILDHGRRALSIPATSEHRITDQAGKTIGWQSANEILALRIQYNRTDNAFLFTGALQAHRWFKDALTAADRPLSQLKLTVNGQPTTVSTLRLIQIGATTRKTLDQARRVWRLKTNAQGALVPNYSETQEVDFGTILLAWVETQPNGLLKVHLTNRTDTTVNNRLVRTYTHSIREVGFGEPFTADWGQTPIQLCFETNNSFQGTNYDAGKDLKDAREKLSAFLAPTRKKP